MHLNGYSRSPMAVISEQTPNPNAMKFTVGVEVGGPGTYVRDSEPEEGFAAEIVQLDGVASVFFTSNFVTVSKTPNASWEEIAEKVGAILETHFPD